MSAENPFELPADAINGGPGTLVTRVCVKAYPSIFGMLRWPRPALQVPETRRPGDGPILPEHDSKKNGRVSFSPGYGCIYIISGLALSLGYQSPLIEG
jgi:hypothetical protein